MKKHIYANANDAPNSNFTFEVFLRTSGKGEKVYYVHFLNDAGESGMHGLSNFLAKNEALNRAADLKNTLPLDDMAKAKAEGKTRKSDWRDGSIADFITWFWSDKGHYVTDRIAAKSP